MPRDISGNYTLPIGNPVVDATIIDVGWANPTMADIAVQLNNVITRDGVLGATAPIFFATGSAAAPSISFTADTALGLYRGGVNILGFATAGVSRGTLSATGAWAFGPPTSGSTLTLTGPGNNYALSVQNAAGQGAIVVNGTNAAGLFGEWQASGTPVGYIGTGSSTATGGTLADFILRAEGTLKFNSGGNPTRGSVNATGNWVFVAPSVGTAFAISGLTGANVLALTNPTSGGTFFTGTDTSVTLTAKGSGAGAIDLISSGGLRIGVSTGSTFTNFTSGGNVVFPGAVSGITTLTISGLAGSDTLVSNGGTSGSFRVTERGLPYGTSIHNNAGAVTGTTNQYITSGDYTPTSASPVNCTVGTVRPAVWSRLGNHVRVSGAVNFAVTAAGAWSFTLTLPFNPNLTQVYQLNGLISPAIATNFLKIAGSGANLASISGNAAAGVISGEYAYVYDFQVIS